MGRTPSPSRRRREKDKERSERKKRRERARERERERERDREREHSREREREREGRRHRSRERGRSREKEKRRRSSSSYRSRSYDRGHPSTSRGKASERPEISEADLEGKSPEEQEMMKTMGFCNFDTTKNRKVDGNDVGDVHVILKRKYRQYMNRKGGFNRPLDFVA